MTLPSRCSTDRHRSGATSCQTAPNAVPPATAARRPADTVAAVDITVVDHPLVTHKLTVLRDVETDSPTFRRLTEELVTLLAYEATREVRVEPTTVQTPVAPATGVRLTHPTPLVVPILRAGLGMLEGMARLPPTPRGGVSGRAGAPGRRG